MQSGDAADQTDNSVLLRGERDALLRKEPGEVC